MVVDDVGAAALARPIQRCVGAVRISFETFLPFLERFIALRNIILDKAIKPLELIGC